jgi:hypothetical protein
MTMATKKKPQPPPPEPTRWELETFDKPGEYTLSRLRKDEPSVWNGVVSVEKYRVTIEKIEEPVEVIHERLRKLWRECTNFHHWTPLRVAAEKYGLVFDDEERGTKPKPKVK